MTLILDKAKVRGNAREVIAEGTIDLKGAAWTCDIHNVQVRIGAGDCPKCIAETTPPDYVPADWLVT